MNKIDALKERIHGCAFSMYGFYCHGATCRDLLDLLKYIEELEKKVGEG